MNQDESTPDRDTRAATGEDADQALSPERREALRRLGKYGAYVAPAMLAMVLSKNAIASVKLDK